MPIYIYRCPVGHEHEEIVSYKERVDRRLCNVCYEVAKLVPSCPTFRFRDADHMPIMTDAKDIWEGTPLEGTDGINQAEHVSMTAQFDLGHTSSTRNKPEMNSFASYFTQVDE